MAYDLLGKNFVPPDVHGKVTGKAKYAEDFRAEGMVFCKLLLSPMPHARVRNVDASAALALPGVLGVLTAADVPQLPAPAEPILTNEPMWIGQPVLAVAAETEAIAADAIDLIKVDFEELPFTVDPLQSLFPGGPDARSDGNAVDNRLIGPPQLKQVKWTAGDFARSEEGQLPMGEPLVEWSYGDIDAGFAKAALVLDETFVTAGMSHHSMEPRSAMAYWENGKCFVFGSTQSQSFVVPGLANLLGITPNELVYVAETCGGGFGSKGTEYPVMAIPGHMSKKIGRPVMLRITRAEEYFFGYARTGFQGRIRMGFDQRGRVTAADLYIVQENGATAGFPDWPSSGETVSILYQPEAMRFRGMCVMTNTVPRSAQRGPGHNQTVSAIEPLIDKAAKQLGIDRLAIRRLERPAHGREGRREPRPRHELLSAGSVRQGGDALQLRGAQSAQRPAQRHAKSRASASARRSIRPASRASTASCASRPTAKCTCTAASATWARTRTRARRASRPRCSKRIGTTASSSAAIRARACPGTSASSAATRRSRWRARTTSRPSTPSTSSKRSRRWISAARRPITTSAASASS